MRTINITELKNLDSTKSSIKHFRYMGWTLQTHRTEIVSGMMRHLNNGHKFQPENGAEDIVTAITELAPELAQTTTTNPKGYTMKIEYPRLGIQSIATDHDGYAIIITTAGTSHTASSFDLRLLARDLITMADEIDTASPTQAEIARDMAEEENGESDNQ